MHALHALIILLCAVAATLLCVSGLRQISDPNYLSIRWAAGILGLSLIGVALLLLLP